MRVGVEAGRRVRRVVLRARPFLQLGVVRRDDGEPRLLRQPARASAWASADPSTGSVPDASSSTSTSERSVAASRICDEVAHVRREGREAHLDRLPVADVGEHVVEDGQHRGLGGRAEPRLVQERGEAERLQRDRLAAGVRAADDERAQGAEVEVDRDGGLRVEQRMPRLEQAHLVGDLDRRAAPRARERRRARAARSIAAVASTSATSASARRRRGSDSSRRMRSTSSRSALDGLGLRVVQLDELERLDEDRLAGGRDVVDDALDASPCARLDFSGKYLSSHPY